MKGKYAGKNPLEKLHGGEPYFFLRAQDKCAPAAVTHYANHLRTNGDVSGAEECHAFAKRMREWQAAHPELVKMPD